MKVNKEKGLKKFKGLLSSLLIVCILVTGLGVTAYGYDNYDYITEVGYIQKDDAQEAYWGDITISIGESKQLETYIWLFAYSVDWYSYNPDIVAVNDEGVITGISEGRAVVEASTTQHIAEEVFPEYFLIEVVPAGATVTQVALGEEHTLALKSDGTLWGWGAGFAGQLGNGARVGAYEPIKIMDNVRHASAGGYHSLAITNDGTLYVWGDNSFGQVGHSYGNDALTPVAVMDNVQYAYAGRFHTFAITYDEVLYAWGHNKYGQIGNNSTYDYVSIPVEIMGSVSRVSGGHNHSMATKRGAASADTLYAWGSNRQFQLGSSNLDPDVIVRVPTMVKLYIREVSAGSYFTLAIDENSYLWGWGSNEFGQLGDGSSGEGFYIVYAHNIMGGVTMVSAGYDHSLAVNHDGVLYAWGKNSNGQIGNGSIGGTVNSPAQIMSNVSYAAAGNDHSALITKNGELYVWGSNDAGQLGLGMGVSHALVPTRVVFPS